ncbi:signal transduction histidine kinase, nitrogen specific [Methylophilaceae bacterium 11]|uniref:two-component system sensor histidine kinase NtrB n=1 Tax=Methylotenera sp. 1P/1 TaxID=1131551 RepID=UPI00037BD183|nr:ATP-binding protein [Methylotenera sp. 1P/1]EUJ09503.1 signal transduction histidine kinase, nitrogen specific [Methylophilaceae bacterium 11]
MQLETLPSFNDWLTSSKRRNLKLFNFYRLTVASVLLFTQILMRGGGLSLEQPIFTTKVLLIYFVLSVIFVVLNWLKKTGFQISLTTQVIIDIGFILLMMHLFGQNQTGVGLLLIITIVFASLISEGRYALFYASIASIGVLLEQTYNLNLDESLNGNYTNAVLLSVACFATAWLAHTLARRMQTSERLASERGVDIANLAKINALITQEMPNGVLVVGEAQQLNHYNQQFTALTGLSDADLSDAIAQKKPLSALTPALSILLTEWAAAEQENKGQENKQADAIKFSLPHRDLGIRFLPTSQSRASGAIIFVEDWSQVQTQAHQVKLAALGRLTANIAHEIRNPLSAISHANQLLQEDNSDPTTLRMLQIISDNVQRLDQIIKDVLELNRRDRTNQESIQLQHFITEFYQQFCAVEKIDPATFTLKLGKDDPAIFFDRRHINQILWNLCKNGWRHCQKNKGSLVLAIKSGRQSQFVNIQIIDDGEGIAPSIQSHLFEPFMTTEKSGTGLGLYIARELAEANGAKLDFTTANTGTVFTLNINKV